MQDSITTGQAGPFPARAGCLILAGNEEVGKGIAEHLQTHDCQPHIVTDDKSAYTYLRKDRTQIVIADIDTEDLGGLALLTFCHQQHASITTYGISPVEDSHHKELAISLGGCRDFFYLKPNGQQIDTRRGIAASMAGRLATKVPCG